MADMTFKVNLLPVSDLGKNLGASNQRWKVYGDLYGNATTASALNPIASIGSSSTSHDVALKNYFSSYNSSVPKNKLISFYDNSNSNGSVAFGYFLDGYNSNPYGGFFVSHYNTPYYVGIQNGTYTNQTILTSTNYTNYVSKLKPVSVNSSTLNSESGIFAYAGSGAPYEGCDWVGLQIGDSSEKWQLMYNQNEGHLSTRFNDNGSTDTGGWSGWMSLLDSSNYTTYTVTKTGGGASGTWSISISGNAATATKTGVAGIWLYPENNNELNIGGTNNSPTIFIGYRAKDSRPIPTKFIFGGSTGSADLQAKTVYLGSGTTSYISSTSYTGNAATATKLAIARTISLTGSVTGSGSFDGSGNLSIATTTNHHHNTLTVGNKTYNGSSNVTIEIADLGLASTTTFLGLTSTNLTNGSTTNPVTITIGPTTGSVTATNGSVVMEADSGEEYIWSGNKWNLMGLASSWALANHIHGNITNAGTITSDTAKASGQHLVITDSNNKICRSAITLGTATNTYLRNDGSWATLGNAATATKLATARSIWGQSFNGTANISGNLIDAGPQIKLPSGQTIFSFLKSDNTAPSAHFGRLGLADTYSDINLTDFRFDVHGNGRFTRSLQAGGTDAIDEQQIDLYGPAGLIYMYSQASTTGNRGLYGRNSDGTYSDIFCIDQLNNTAFFGNHLLQLHTNGTRKQEIDDYHTTVWSSQVGANAFGGSAIEIRETNLVGNTQSSMDYAPKLGFHWSGRAAGFLGLNQFSWFELKAMDNSGYMGLNVGGLTSYNGSINVQLQNVDASLANNNISGTIYPTSSNILDSAGRILARQEAVLTSDGVIKSFWYVRNYNTSGNLIVQKGITLTANKDGSFRADCSSPFYGAVWNDYAEYRKSNITEPGRCIKETGNGDLILTTKRLEKGCEIISDTFGFAIGQSDICKTPTAATGRVLAYLLEPIEEAKKNIGQAVCSGPNGTVSIMTDEECRLWPQCIIGTISEIPDYEIWHAGMQEGNKFEEIQVNGRIWIRIR